MTITSKGHSDESMLYVVSYDIPDDRRRTRVHTDILDHIGTLFSKPKGAWHLI
jgi:hypothetical protein